MIMSPEVGNELWIFTDWLLKLFFVAWRGKAALAHEAQTGVSRVVKAFVFNEALGDPLFLSIKARQGLKFGRQYLWVLIERFQPNCKICH